jgi:peroxiredoxin Q/BCP
MDRRSFTLALAASGVALALPGLAAALEVGEKAPDFDLPSTKGGNFKMSSLAGKKNLLIQFYLIDFTPT